MRHLPRVVFVLCLLPLAWLGVRAATTGLGTNPIETLLNALGWWALVLLLSSLGCTPVTKVFHVAWPMRLRRMLGLFAFTYATLHLLTYAVLDQGLDVPSIIEDVTKRKFITAGMTAWLLLLPLAITSTKGWQRRLGKRWRRLHRLAYVAGVAGCVHFLWRVKVIQAEQIGFALVLGVLLLVRVVGWLRRRA